MGSKKPNKTKRNALKHLKAALVATATKLSPVCVEWRDASGIACGWTPSKDVSERGAEEPMILTCGWLVESHKTYILVALSVDPQADTQDMVLKIPRENIRKLRKLKV